MIDSFILFYFILFILFYFIFLLLLLYFLITLVSIGLHKVQMFCFMSAYQSGDIYFREIINFINDLFIYLFIYFIYLFIYLFILFIYLFIYLFILFIYLFYLFYLFLFLFFIFIYFIFFYFFLFFFYLLEMIRRNYYFPNLSGIHKNEINKVERTSKLFQSRN